MDVAGLLEVFLLPELLEILHVITRQSLQVDFDNVVFHYREGVVGHVGRTGPDGFSIAHDVFAVHQFHSGNAAPRISERLDKCAGACWSRVLTGGKIWLRRFIGVVAKTNCHACLSFFAQCHC